MLNFINRALVGLHTGEDGQTFVEYALILAGVSVAIALAAMWTGLATSLGSAVTQVSSAIGP